MVDDEPEIRAIVRKILEREGYEVEEAESGRRGVELISEEEFDVLLLDVLLPDADGWEVCRCVSKRVRVVIFTVLSSEEDVRRSRECGAAVHLSKPFPREELLRAVRCARLRKVYNPQDARAWDGDADG